MVRSVLSVRRRLGLDHPLIYGGGVRIFGSTPVTLSRAPCPDEAASRPGRIESRGQKNPSTLQGQSRTLLVIGLPASLLEGAVDLAKTRASRLAGSSKGLAESTVNS